MTAILCFSLSANPSQHIDAKDHHDPLTSEGRRIDQIRHERGYKKNRSLHLNEPLDASAASNQLRSFSPTRNFTNKNQEKVEEDLIDLAWPASSKAKSLSRPESISRDTSSNASSIPRQRTQLTVVANASESDEPSKFFLPSIAPISIIRKPCRVKPNDTSVNNTF